jgi:hypothetical protein
MYAMYLIWIQLFEWKQRVRYEVKEEYYGTRWPPVSRRKANTDNENNLGGSTTYAIETRRDAWSLSVEVRL